uniref:TTF-type domain-containing protein n=1 Tax=Neogobius melanostomus TaxID=47308 RepID=A0A8C6WU32_9GOBI
MDNENLTQYCKLKNSVALTCSKAPFARNEEQAASSDTLTVSDQRDVGATAATVTSCSRRDSGGESDSECDEQNEVSRTKQCVLDDDPASCPKEVTDDQRCSLVRRGPVQVKQHFPKNAEGRRFTCNNYQMQMRNGEKVNRSWLVYSVRKDAVFCFCCRLFADKEKRSHLSGDGFNSWKNLAAHLKQHEKSAEHMDNMDTWLTLSQRLKTCTAIDQVNQNLISLEVNRWKEVLRRLLAIVNHLAEHNLAFRGHSDRLYEPGNGNFLGQVQLMAQFDPIMQEHLRRVQAKEISDTYLSKPIQNELISLVAQCTINAIVERVKTAKYYAVIMDCTPDLSHNEQLSVVLRIVNCEPSKGVSIHEHFVGFLLAPDTTGKGLCDLYLGHLDTLSLDLTNCRGQAYDNGSNMQGKKQGVQRRVLELNNKALFVPCGSHTLNLVVGDAAKSSVRSISFFGLLQRLYTLFSSSVNRWAILRKHVKDLSVKALSTTRWECRVEAVKAVRYQLPEILNALSELTDYAMEKRDAEVVSTARGICQEMQRLPFLVSTIVWYNVLFQINKVSKILQSPNVSVETVRKEITAVTEFLQDFREHGFNAAVTDAREIAAGTEVEMSWPEVRRRQTQQTAEELFKTEFFLHLIDTALVTVRERFSHLETFYELYGFLYSSEIMKSTVQNGRLAESCYRLQQTTDDVDAEDLNMEITRAVRAFPTTISSPFEMLNHIYKENVLDVYPNLSIALRLLLTLPVTVASGERSFSALKLIKTYLRTTMSQERLSALALLSIEQKVRKTLDMESVIARFAEAKARKVRF